MKHWFKVTSILIFVMFAFCHAEKRALQIDSVFGWGWFTTGRVEQAPFDSASTNFRGVDFNKEWRQNIEAGVKIGAGVGKRTRACLHAGFSINYPVLTKFGKLTTATAGQKKVSPFLLEASLASKFDIIDPLGLSIKYGYFPIKYNPEARNLGEYLFRSNTYPGYLFSGFEISDKVKIFGLRLGTTLFDKLDQDLVIKSETDIYPLYDFSIAYLVRYRPFQLVDFGAGIDFDRYISVDNKKTVPGTDTAFFKGFFTDYLYRHIDENGDTTDYSFAGTRVMARLTLDPKWIFNIKFFGKEDFKLYTEAAMLGTKDYPLWYEDIGKRIPVMFGFNFPAFKLLDVLALEFEWYDHPYLNSTENIWENRSPVPYTDDKAWEPNDSTGNITGDNWKWSVYGTKTLFDFIRFSFQFARDHSMPGQGLYEETVRDPGDWYWTARVMFIF